MTDKVSKIVEKIGIVQAKQAQNKVEQASNKDNSDKLGEELHRLKAELEAAKKPELRHGDIRAFGISSEMGILDLSEPQHHVIWKNGDKRNCASADKSELVSTISEVFDDLKALSESLTEFEIRNRDRDNDRSLKIELTDYGHVRISIKPDGGATGRQFTVSCRDLSDLSMAVRRLQHTLRSKKSD